MSEQDEPLADEIIIVEPWHTEVGVYYDGAEFSAWIESHGVECHHINGMHAACGLVYDGGQDFYTMYIPESCALPSVYHEALHMAWRLLDGHGVKVKMPNDELLTYFQEYIVRLLVDAVPHLKQFQDVMTKHYE